MKPVINRRPSQRKSYKEAWSPQDTSKPHLKFNLSTNKIESDDPHIIDFWSNFMEKPKNLTTRWLCEEFLRELAQDGKDEKFELAKPEEKP